MLNRRHVLSLFAAAGAAGLARPAWAQSSAPIRVGCLAGESTGSALYAQDEGFFTKRGLNVSISTSITNAAAAAAMLGGALDVAIADIVVLSEGHDKGLPFALLAPAQLHSIKVPTLAIAVRDPAVKIGKDFNGKTFGCATITGLGYLVTAAWVDNNGGDSKTLKWVEVPFPAGGEALKRGTIDAFVAPDPFISNAIALGNTLVLLETKPIAPVMLQGAWYSTKDWVSKNPAAAKGFADAIREANVWGNANPQATAEILSKYSKVPQTAIMAMKMRGAYQEHFDLSTLQPLINGAAKYGLISKPFPAKELLAPVAT
jgi:NitT/TauT family transport system substrate-binding protein